MHSDLFGIDEPENYFTGLGNSQLPSPTSVLLFLRTSKKKLQQHALQNRSHHRFVLAINLGTEGHVHLDNLDMPFKPGQALLILPYQFHHFSKLASTRLKWLFCTFELEAQGSLEPLRNRVLDMENSSSSLIDDLPGQLLEQLLGIWRMPRVRLQAAQLQSSLLSLLISLRRLGGQSEPALLPETDDNLLRTVNFLLAQWRGRSVTVADLAGELGFSESRLRVIFKQTAGIPLGAYIKNYRLNRAMALLRTSALPIATIAEEAGFGSPQAFSRIFKKETGRTPRSYRQ
ncbi:helix-turn-helix transcriptional regulator [Akkermansiaceae bacterium]|nr:helix-turn-helix transcriptional regulator [Akkermansiaceae bacterium]